MKPIYLEFCGINSFSEKAEIDFRTLLSGGVFGIFGDTGSGKSTVLDCIHLALYGEIERSGGSDCINYKQDSAYVLFDFEITLEGERKTFRVRRERKRKNNTAKAFLYEKTETGLLALAEGTREVNEKIRQIIGLSFDDFKMCIALPQGDFAALLKAPTSERVKLVSRLFDLEKYGERLSKAANEKYYQAENQVNLLLAKMEQNADGGEEAIEEINARFAQKTETLIKLNQDLSAAETEWEKANRLDKEKKEYDALCAEWEQMQLRLPQMQERRRAIERIPHAKAVLREGEELKSNRSRQSEAQKGYERAERGALQGKQTLLARQKAFAEEKFEEKQLKLSLYLERVRGAKADFAAEEEARKKLAESRAEYKRLLALCPQEDFSALKSKVQAEIDALGEDENLLDYLKHRFKGALLSDTYAEIRGDLKALGEKYPAAGEDVKRLMEKYTLQEGEESFDINADAAFKEMEEKRRRLKKELSAIEERERKYLANEKDKETLATQGRIYGDLYAEAQKKTQALKELGSEAQILSQRKSLEERRKLAEKEIEALQAQINAREGEMKTQKGVLEVLQKAELGLREALERALQESGFASVDEAAALFQKSGGEKEGRECEDFFKRYEIAKHGYEKTDRRKFDFYSENAVKEAADRKSALQAEKEALIKEIAALESERKRLEALREKYERFQAELTKKQAEKELCDELRQLLKSNKFLEYIASEYLQEICSQASKTLLSLTGGRYFLRYEKEFKVGDNLDGGSLRAVKTLSGGETFLASLSLALSLSAAICLKSLRPIEFFFLDEGFGTLDEKLVDTVMDVLTKLSKSFSVGLISHVEELKHRIDNKLLVTGATESHGSKVRMETF